MESIVAAAPSMTPKLSRVRRSDELMGGESYLY
jgi:hypothetical protein